MRPRLMLVADGSNELAGNSHCPTDEISRYSRAILFRDWEVQCAQPCVVSCFVRVSSAIRLVSSRPIIFPRVQSFLFANARVRSRAIASRRDSSRQKTRPRALKRKREREQERENARYACVRVSNSLFFSSSTRAKIHVKRLLRFSSGESNE